MATEELEIRIGANTDGLKSGLDEAKNQVSGFEKSIESIGTAIVAAFAVQKIIEFGAEISALAAKAEGIQSAFNLQFDITSISTLREAVQGTVADMELMQLAMKAKDLGIPIQNLAKYLEYADAKADATGQEFSALANTIITGIGRESTRALITLGISQEQFNAQLAISGNYTDSINVLLAKQMETYGQVKSEALDAQDKINAGWENTKVVLGGLLNQFLVPFKKGIADALQQLTSLFNITQQIANIHIAETTPLYEQLIGEGKGDAAAKLEIINGLFAKQSKVLRDLQILEAEAGSVAQASMSLKYQGLKKEQQGIAEAIEYWKKYKKVVASPIDPIKGKDVSKDLITADDEKLFAKAVKKYKEFYERLKKINATTIFASPLEAQVKSETDRLEALFKARAAKIGAAMKETADTIRLQSEDEADAIKTAGANTSELIKTAIADTIEETATGLTELANSDITAEDFGKNMLLSLLDFVGQFGKILIALGLSKIALDKIGISGIGAVVAGAALVALSAAASSMLSKSSSAMTSSSPVSSSMSTASTNYASQNSDSKQYEFVIQGNNLVGVLNRQNNLKKIST